MNKAFIREPESDGRAYCPRCGNLGLPVGGGPLDKYIRSESRSKMHDAAWFCNFPRCEVAYFNQFEETVVVDELTQSVYPKDFDAPLCACFGLTYADVEADIREGQPKRIRELLAKSKSPEAQCATLAADGRCCMATVQELYMKLRGPA
jgi:CopZ-like zinc binding protein